MIFGIGIDNIEVARVGRQIAADKGFRDKVFTPSEIAYCEEYHNSSERYAARFAAKEAFLKALGTGWQGGISFTEVEVVNNELGKPEIVTHGKVREHLVPLEPVTIHVSLTHLKEIASAVVLIEQVIATKNI